MGYAMKIILAGDGGVGKTSLIRRYVEDAFSDDYLMSIGTKISKKVVAIKSGETGKATEANLAMWDIAGQKRFEALHRSFYRGANGRFIVYDVSRPETMERVIHWIQSVDEVTGDIPTVIVGNKADLIEPGTPPPTPPKDILGNRTLIFTSAKEGANVEGAFISLAQECLDRIEARR